MTTQLIARPVTITSLEAELKHVHNGRKQPTTSIKRNKKVHDLTTATKQGHKVSNQTRTTTSNGKKVTEHTGYTYKELQAALKAMGVKASGSTDVLTARLERARTNTLLDTDYPKQRKSAGKKRTKKQPAPKRNWNGLSYRQAQRLVKWGKENIVGFTAPKRNTGWDNVEANCDALLDCDHFWTVLDDPNIAQELKDLTGFTA